MNQGRLHRDVFITAADTLEEIGSKLAGAMTYVARLRGPVLVHYNGEPRVMLVPPDAGLAWARAEEAGRLSGIATEAAGLGHVVYEGPDRDLELGPE
jgi:hypothetical protein